MNGNVLKLEWHGNSTIVPILSKRERTPLGVGVYDSKMPFQNTNFNSKNKFYNPSVNIHTAVHRKQKFYGKREQTNYKYEHTSPFTLGIGRSCLLCQIKRRTP